MASRTPFLTTDVGNAKEIIDWSGCGAMLPTVTDLEGFSKAEIKSSSILLEEIYRQPEERRLMREAGFRAWQERFTWEKITNDYEKLYKTV